MDIWFAKTILENPGAFAKRLSPGRCLHTPQHPAREPSAPGPGWSRTVLPQHGIR